MFDSLLGVSDIKERGFDALLNEEVVLYREEFRGGVVKPDIHKGKLLKDGDSYYVQNESGRVDLRDGDRIMFKGWERTFRKNI